MSQIFQRHFHDAWVQIPAENEANERIAVHRKASLARKKPGRCQSVNERAGSVGVPKPSLSALQQRDCRQGLNLQEVYRVLTSRRMSLELPFSDGCRTKKVWLTARSSLVLPIALVDVLFPPETGGETVMGTRQARI